MRNQKEIMINNDSLNNVLSIIPKTIYFFIHRIAEIFINNNDENLIEENKKESKEKEKISDKNLSSNIKSKIKKLDINSINGNLFFKEVHEFQIWNIKKLLNQKKVWTDEISNLNDLQVLSEILFDWMDDSVEYI